MRNKWGIVFEGGNGNGAYQVGAWKAIEQAKDSFHVTAVSGTSAGALNAAMYACMDAKRAEEIWLELAETNMFVRQNKDFIQNIENALRKMYYKHSASLPQTINGFIHSLDCDGWLREEAIGRVINENNISKLIQSGNVECYVACAHIRKHAGYAREKFFELSKENAENISNIIQASFAIPNLYTTRKIGGKDYYDGRFLTMYQNWSVIQALYERGYRDIIIVHLGEEKSNFYPLHGRYGVGFLTNKWSEKLSKEECRDIYFRNFFGANFIHIYPSKDLKMVGGTAAFGVKGMKEKIELGYQDAAKALNSRKQMKNNEF